jgi:type II secretory pathway component PulK
MALLAALLAVALLTVIVVEMTDATLVDAHFTRNTGNAIAARLLAQSAEVAAEALLVQDTKDNPNVTCRYNLWAFPFAGVPLGEGGSVGFLITDEQGKLDLNAAQAFAKEFEKLFDELGIDTALLARIVQWTDPQSVAGQEISDYCSPTVRCEPRHLPLVSVDELRLIQGFDEHTVERLRPYVTALPKRGGSGSGGVATINVNSALPPVLSALGCQVGADFRPPSPGCFNDRVAFNKVVTCEGDASSRRIGFTSSFFSITATGTLGDTSQSVVALVERGSGSQVTRHLWRTNPLSELPPSEAP